LGTRDNESDDCCTDGNVLFFIVGVLQEIMKEERKYPEQEEEYEEIDNHADEFPVGFGCIPVIVDFHPEAVQLFLVQQDKCDTDHSIQDSVYYQRMISENLH
jgi:hypothetical protein